MADVKDGLPSTDFSRMNREYIKAVAENAAGGGGGGDLPKITDDDIGKALVVGSEPTTVFLIPKQTVNKDDSSGTIFYHPTNTDNSGFTIGTVVSLNWNGENLGTATVQHGTDFNINYAAFEQPKTGNQISVEDANGHLRINFAGAEEGTAPESAVVSLTKSGQKAVWSVGSIVEKLEIDWDKGEFANTWQEIKDMLSGGKFLYFISSYDDTSEMCVVSGTYVNGTSYVVDTIDLHQLTGDAGHYLWSTDSPNGHPHNDD